MTNAYHPSFIMPPPAQQISNSASTAGAAATNKDDEVTSSEEANNRSTNNNDKPTYIQNSFMMSGIGLMMDPDGFFESSAKLLYLAVKWAKSMPSFMQTPLKDQTILLENAWSELFILTAAQYGGLVIESM